MRGAALRGKGNAARTQKCKTKGGKASYGGKDRDRGSKWRLCQDTFVAMY